MNVGAGASLCLCACARTPLTCDDERVGHGGLGQHPLDVSAEELEGLAAAAVRVHQDHDPAGPTHLAVRHT